MCALVTGVQTCALPICALIKNAEALERFAAVDTLIVDKTGTLTLGKPALVAVLPKAGVDEDELLSLAASLERGSEHPLAAAIVAGARSAEHTSELQSIMRISYYVFCFKKNTKTTNITKS